MGIEKNIEALERKKLSVLNEHKDGYWAATTYKILMLNQFAYGEIVELKSAMNSEQCYKFGLKRAMNNLEAEMTKYNKVVWGFMNGMEEMFDDIENRITDAVKKDIDILYYSVLSEVEKLGVKNAKSLTRCRQTFLLTHLMLLILHQELHLKSFADMITTTWNTYG